MLRNPFRRAKDELRVARRVPRGLRAEGRQPKTIAAVVADSEVVQSQLAQRRAEFVELTYLWMRFRHVGERVAIERQAPAFEARPTTQKVIPLQEPGEGLFAERTVIENVVAVRDAQ